MIICSREEASRLISDENNLFKDDERNRDIIDYNVVEIKHGRGAGTENITPEMRALIAEYAITSGLSNEEVAKEFGISWQAVEAYKNGANSLKTYNQPDTDLHEKVTQVKQQVQEDIKQKAQNKILTAIEALTDSKISSAKAKDIAGIAKDMASVVRNITPENGSVNINQRVLVYSPRLKEEDDYKVINAKD